MYLSLIFQCGYGLPESECYALYIALNMLTIKEPVATVRFGTFTLKIPNVAKFYRNDIKNLITVEREI